LLQWAHWAGDQQRACLGRLFSLRGAFSSKRDIGSFGDLITRENRSSSNVENLEKSGFMKELWGGAVPEEKRKF
jgi:hypothetical protein